VAGGDFMDDPLLFPDKVGGSGSAPGFTPEDQIVGEDANALKNAALTMRLRILELEAGALGAAASFVDEETPEGVVDGANAAFTLSQAPSPASSLRLYLNGLRQLAGVHFALVGAGITYSQPPELGDVHRADYRY